MKAPLRVPTRSRTLLMNVGVWDVQATQVCMRRRNPEIRTNNSGFAKSLERGGRREILDGENAFGIGRGALYGLPRRAMTFR